MSFLENEQAGSVRNAGREQETCSALGESAMLVIRRRILRKLWRYYHQADHAGRIRMDSYAQEIEGP
jgi:hypothetical protein